ncbi:MAG: DNA-binding protein [Opitutaceae bacterium]|nr:DNA-binding protein [Opitutaceae bacterium]|tara:strand:+ start:1939 stop:2253 length:315 start_codon:yes stop_codon:yes gene_type:complete
MNKAELVLSVQRSLGGDTSEAQAEGAIDTVVDAIKNSVREADEKVKIKGDTSEALAIQLMGFGTFYVARRNARTGVNPATGEKIKIDASKVVKFKPGAGLKALV